MEDNNCKSAKAVGLNKQTNRNTAWQHHTARMDAQKKHLKNVAWRETVNTQ